MSDLVYVSGHKNPDTDSVCAAISYSYLLNKTKKYNAVPVRLGEISRETEYILKRFNKDIPMLLKCAKYSSFTCSTSYIFVFFFNFYFIN